MTPHIRNRLLALAVACWALWSLLIWQARPAPPARVAQAMFLFSMVAALAGCVWTCWPLAPRRRWVGVAAGVGTFVVILAVGHALGTALSQAAS